MLSHYLCQVTDALKDYYFLSDGHIKHRCKRWLNSTFLQISKSKSLALLINNIFMFQDVFNNLHLIQNKLKR